MESKMTISLELPSDDKTFIIFDKTINISPERQLYNHIRGEFYLKSKQIYDKACTSYDIEFLEDGGDLDYLCKEGYAWGLNFILQIINFSVNELRNQGIFDMTTELFIEKYYSEVDAWYIGFMNIYDQYMNIILEAEQLEEYRSRRKNNRGRFIGGGFGVSGAISGAAQAGALNIATGILHSGFNLVGKAFTAMHNNREKQKIFNNPNTKKNLLSALHKSIFDTRIAFMKASVDYDKYDTQDYLSGSLQPDDEKKSIRLLSNLHSKNIPENEIKNVCVDLVNLNPFNIEIYYYIVEKFGDNLKETESIANYFYIDLKEYKNSLALKKYSNLGFKSEQKLLNNIQELKKYCEHIGLSEIKEVTELEKAYDIFINQPFIIDGYKYSDENSKEQALKDINSIRNYLTPLNIRLPSCSFTRPYTFKEIYIEQKTPNNIANQDSELCSLLSTEINKISGENSIADTVKKLSKIITPLQNESFISHHGKILRDIIISSYKKLDLQAKMVNGTIYSTIDAAENARREIKQDIENERSQILKYDDFSDINTISLEYIREAISFLNNFQISHSQTTNFLAERQKYWRNALINKEIEDINKINSSVEEYPKKKVLKAHIERLKKVPSPSTKEAQQVLEDTIHIRERRLAVSGFSLTKEVKEQIIAGTIILFVLVGYFGQDKKTVEEAPANTEIATTEPETIEQRPISEPTTTTSEAISTPIPEATSNTQLPFIGERSFNFMGGTGTGYSITINQNGDTVVMSVSTEGSAPIYEGGFENPILFNESEGILFQDGKVYSITDNVINKGCSGDEQEPCVSKLYGGD